MLSAKHFAALSGLAVFVFAAGCTVGPKYQRASVPVPAKWDVAEPWRESAPKDGVAKGEWWSVFQDGELSALEKQALDANQTIKIAVAHLEQARASAALQVATQFPTLSTTPSAQRQRLSGNRPANSNFPVRSPVSQTNVVLPFTVGYEADLFGRRRRWMPDCPRISWSAARTSPKPNARWLWPTHKLGLRARLTTLR